MINDITALGQFSAVSNSDGQADDQDSVGNSTDNIHLQLNHIKKTFGEITACEDVTLDIGQDEFVVFLGPSGCGKTTTLRCIAGLEDPDGGSIYLAGNDITHFEPKDRNIAFVFQNITLFPHMDVSENIRFGLDMKTSLSAEKKNKRVQNVGDLLGISELLDRLPKDLSGGQRQRVSIGRAMVMEPDAFLLDEPFSALDANLRDQMHLEIQKLQRELDTTMVFVTHDQDEAMTLGDRIVVMNDGRIQQAAPPHEIYNDPENLFVAEFIGSPSVNTFQCTARTTDGLRIDHESFELTLSEKQAESFEEQDGQSLVMAIRPEYTDIDAADADFEAQITLIQSHGDRDVVHLTTGDVEFTAQTPQNKVRDTDTMTRIALNTDRIWLFSQAGERLL